MMQNKIAFARLVETTFLGFMHLIRIIFVSLWSEVDNTVQGHLKLRFILWLNGNRFKYNGKMERL